VEPTGRIRLDAWHAKAAIAIIALVAAMPIVAALLLRDDPNDAFRAMAASVDRIVVSEGPTAVGEPESASITDMATVRSIIGGVRFDSNGIGGFLRCRCAGHHRIEFFDGDAMLASMTVHHGTRVRWKRFKGDVPLTAESRATLSGEFAKLGLEPFPDESGH